MLNHVPSYSKSFGEKSLLRATSVSNNKLIWIAYSISLHTLTLNKLQWSYIVQQITNLAFWMCVQSNLCNHQLASI